MPTLNGLQYLTREIKRDASYSNPCQSKREKLLIMMAKPIMPSEAHCLASSPPRCVRCLFLKQSLPPQKSNLCLTEPSRPPSHALNVSLRNPAVPRVQQSRWNNYWPKGKTLHLCASHHLTRQAVSWRWDVLTVREKGKKGLRLKRQSNPGWSLFSINLATKRRSEQIMRLRGTLIRIGMWWIAPSTAHL